MRSYPRSPRSSPPTWKTVAGGVGVLAAVFAALVAVEYPLVVGAALFGAVVTAVVARRAARGAVTLPGTGRRLRVSVYAAHDADYWECAVALEPTDERRSRTV